MTTKVIITHDDRTSKDHEVLVKTMSLKEDLEINRYILKPGDSKSFYVHSGQSLEVIEIG
jgi:hypothetical protein